MRATKGLWAALGAGMSIAAAGLLVLASISVVLAVGGWPKGHYAHDDTVALRAQQTAAHAHGPAGAAPASGTAAGGRRERHAPAHRTVRHLGVQRRAGRRPAATHPGTAVNAPASAPVTGSAPSGSSGGSSTGSGAPVTQVTDTAGTTVTNVTDTAGQLLDPVSKPVADTVTSVGQQAGQTVDQTVGGVVGGLTGSQ